MLHCEEHKIFGKNFGGSFKELIERLLSAGAAVDPKVYELAFKLNVALRADNEAFAPAGALYELATRRGRGNAGHCP